MDSGTIRTLVNRAETANDIPTLRALIRDLALVALHLNEENKTEPRERIRQAALSFEDRQSRIGR